MTREIPLTRGLVALVDDEDYGQTMERKWCAVPAGKRTFYAQCAKRLDMPSVSLHGFLTGWKPVDHINGDGLDNRRHNLRPATTQENSRNRAGWGRSGYKGVVAWRSKWRSTICVGGKLRYLGLFDSPEDAALVYDEAARDLFGEFAWLNFPDDLLVPGQGRWKSIEAQPADVHVRRTPCTNTSGYRGVTKGGRKNPWRAGIGYGGKRYDLGGFPTIEHAALAYDKAACELFGESAQLNFPDTTLAPAPLLSVSVARPWIPLSRDLAALVDDDDYEQVMQHKWSASPSNRTSYAITGTGAPDGRKTTMSMHKFLTGWALVDHINGDGLDNRRSNLRPATTLENNRNRRKASNCTSGYKGVTMNARSQRSPWKARIGINGKRRDIGVFATAEEAARAYDKAAKEHYGEFAWLNFPDAHTSVADPATGN